MPQTVSRHIQVQRTLPPGMEGEHLANRPADKPRPPSAGWMANISALAAFRTEQGRYPTTGDGDLASKRLAQWLSLQRRAHKAGTLPEDRRQILDALPGWDSNQRAAMEAERWTTRLEQLRAFRAAEGRWPRFRAQHDEAERVLGVWLHGQRQAFGRGRLSRTELRLLVLRVPGWNAWRVKHEAALARSGQPVSGGHE